MGKLAQILQSVKNIFFQNSSAVQQYNEIPRDSYNVLMKHPWARRKLLNVSLEQDMEGSHYHGILNTIANDCVGPCPIIIGQSDETIVNMDIEDKWLEFCQQNEIGNSIRLLRRSAARSGTCIGIPYMKQNVDPKEHGLGIRVLSTERLANPVGANIEDRIFEGIEYDENWDPIKIYLDTEESYSLLPNKDGSQEAFIWWKKKDECRLSGVPECSPALCILPSIKRYLDCLIRSAEFRSAIPMAIKLDPNIWGKEAAEAVGMPTTAFKYEPGMIPTLPPGTSLEGLSYTGSSNDDLAALDAMVGAAARCVNMPLNLATGNSSNHNMASSQVDFGPWKNAVKIDRQDFSPVSTTIIRMWMRMGALKEGYFKPITRKYIEQSGIRYALSYSSVFSHPDPLKISNSRMTDLISGVSTLVREYTEEGRNPRRELQREAELLGITYEELTKIILANRTPAALQVLKIESTPPNG